jgi:hypothetical protein
MFQSGYSFITLEETKLIKYKIVIPDSFSDDVTDIQNCQFLAEIKRRYFFFIRTYYVDIDNIYVCRLLASRFSSHVCCKILLFLASKYEEQSFSDHHLTHKMI